MRFLLLIIVLVGCFGLKGQEADSVNTDTLKFVLEVLPTIDVETNDTLTNVNLKIAGTDGSSREYKSDSLGVFPVIDLKPNTAYSVIVSKNKYLNAKGKETTIGSMNSKKFIHEYALQKLFVCFGHGIPNITYAYNNLEPYLEETGTELANIHFDILTENPSIVIQIQGYRDKSEKKKISKQRAENYKTLLVKMGINKKRLVVVDKGIGNHETPKENRTIKFRVISTDFEPK